MERDEKNKELYLQFPDDLTIEDFVYHYDNGESIFLDEWALAYLLTKEICFINTRPYVTYPWEPKEKWGEHISEESTVVVFVNTSDVFAWGGADAECLGFKSQVADDSSPLYHLLRCCLEDEVYGSVRWACIKRNQQPQKPFRDRMKEAGVWDDVMEALPANGYDGFLEERLRRENANSA